MIVSELHTDGQVVERVELWLDAATVTQYRRSDPSQSLLLEQRPATPGEAEVLARLTAPDPNELLAAELEVINAKLDAVADALNNPLTAEQQLFFREAAAAALRQAAILRGGQ